MKKKICPACKTKKSISEFSFNKGRPDGLSGDCKTCHRIIRKEYYDNNRKKECNRVKSRKIYLKKWFDKLKKTLKCERCPESDSVCLDFHHKNPDEKEINLCNATNNGWSRKRILKEIEKCNVLCANCHRKEHDMSIKIRNVV